MTQDSISSARFVPPVGGFQEVERRRVFVHRAGGGGPAVVFLPGASAVGLDYFGVQQGVSRFTTAVVYDRGGTGYSDRLPLPRTAAAVAGELRQLLRAQNIAGPYVLAAHSLGGLYAHRFAQLFPWDVAGLVWMDPGDPRLAGLIDDLDAWEIEHERDSHPRNVRLVVSRIAQAAPAWQRIVDALAHRAEQRRDAARGATPVTPTAGP
ncbi:alpha/beta hydrolase [Nocardia sp. CDC159]|uniref:Alpha/beta hydrolase n=1 Tax=Nocardia pulmonis TaxID=2951408 RepID=A0A9X2EE19_9NOCA|nr:MULTISPECIES: alpha/beta fold hydrolase [Nocardia]MCM6778744.1 alpha/beta hydrolase [Nocardia pulmonis]MCM6791633.1 alpha/beta hydrolase [Nocardia sp. CDC159]